VTSLADSRHLRRPRLDVAPAGQFRVHVKIVQDRNPGSEDAECMTAAPISLSQALAAFDDVYSPRIVGRVNDYDVKVAHTAGEHVWHVHEHTDEFFLVIDGRFAITLREPGGQERIVELSAGDIFVVPKGTEHKPSSPGGAILMFELRGTLTTGDRHEGDIPAYVDTTTGRDIGE
jgi:mannose-6-phosphate isomerase-like protein (cupin superfamily)